MGLSEPTSYSRVSDRLPRTLPPTVVAHSPKSHLVESQAQAASAQARHALANYLLYLMASRKAFSQSAEKFGRQIQFGFHCEEPPKGGYYETQPDHDPVPGGPLADGYRHRCLRSRLCQGQCALRL